MDRDPFDLVGEVLERQFRVLEVAGEGDLSIVYKAHHLGVDAPVAVKCLHLPATLDGLLAEPLLESFREASRLHYRLAKGNLHIAQSLASGTTIAPRTGRPLPYLVREWFEGESLASDLRRRREQGKKGRSIEGTVKLLEPAVEGVAYAHTQGVVHLSLHPSNLFISREGNKYALKVLDFGVARTMNELASGLPSGAQPSPGFRVLFPEYAAPEQLDRSIGAAGPATDVYALALLLMEVLSDRPVLSGKETGALVEKALDWANRPTPRAHGLILPKGIEAALEQAVALEPAERQKNVAAFWNEVRASLKFAARSATGSSSAPPPSGNPYEAELAILSEYRPKAATLVGLAPAEAPAPVPRTPPPAASFPLERVDAPAPPFEPGQAGSPPPKEASQPPPAPEPEPAHAPAEPAPRLEAEASRGEPASGSGPSPGIPVAALAPASALALASERPAALPARRRPKQPFLVSLSRIPPLLLAAVAVVSAAAITVVFAVVLVTIRGRPKVPPPSLPAAASLSSAPAPLAPSGAPSNPLAAPAPAPSPSGRFDPAAARHALESTATDVLRCRRDKLPGSARAKVTFASDGSVAQVVLGAPLRGTSAGECVVGLLTTVRVPAFVGKPATVDYPFVLGR